MTYPCFPMVIFIKKEGGFAMKEKMLKNYIDGKWEDVSDRTLVINPATGEELVQVPLSGKEDVDRAVKAAKRAQKEWALVPAPQRAEILYRVGTLLKERKEHLSRLLTMENGK